MQAKKSSLAHNRLINSWLLVGLVNLLCLQSTPAQDAISDDKAKRAEDKQTLTEDLQALASCAQTLNQCEKELSQAQTAIQAAKAKSQGDPALSKLIKDEQAKVAVAQEYVQQYRDYYKRLEERVARDRSILQQDSIDRTADDASFKLSQEEALRAALDPVNNPGYVDPNAGGNYPPDYQDYGYAYPYGYGHGYRGHSGAYGSSGGRVSGGSRGSAVSVGGGRR